MPLAHLKASTSSVLRCCHLETSPTLTSGELNNSDIRQGQKCEPVSQFLKRAFFPQVLHISIFKTREVGHQTSQAFSFYWKLSIFLPGKGCLPLSSDIRCSEPRAALPTKHCFHSGRPHSGRSVCELHQFLCDENDPSLITHQHIQSPGILAFMQKPI